MCPKYANRLSKLNYEIPPIYGPNCPFFKGDVNFYKSWHSDKPQLPRLNK